MELSLPKLQRAAEISFDRLGVRLRNGFTAPVLQKRAEAIAYHFAVALGLPIKRNSGLDLQKQHDDMLGPMLSCLLYGLTLCWGQIHILLFVFATWILGSLLVFLLFRLLGSSHDLWHVANAVGYSIAPLTVLSPVMSLTDEPLPWFSLLIKFIAVLFASRSASLVLVQPSTEKKIFLFELPLLLFYVYLLGYRSGA